VPPLANMPNGPPPQFGINRPPPIIGGGGGPMNMPMMNMPAPPVMIPVLAGPVPRFPSFFVVVAFVAFLGLIAEIDSMSKYAGRMSSKYAGSGGGLALQKIIVLAVIAGGIGLIFFLSYSLVSSHIDA
jgi:hypothetical protein